MTLRALAMAVEHFQMMSSLIAAGSNIPRAEFASIIERIRDEVDPAVNPLPPCQDRHVAILADLFEAATRGDDPSARRFRNLIAARPIAMTLHENGVAGRQGFQVELVDSDRVGAPARGAGSTAPRAIVSAALALAAEDCREAIRDLWREMSRNEAGDGTADCTM
jgi:hypothetical protein